MGPAIKLSITLQLVQNRLTRVVCNVGKRDQHITDLLRGFHWLSVRSRVTFKMVTLCFKARRYGQSGYLNIGLQRYVSVRTLRSSDQGLLVMPASKIKTAARRFSVAAHSVWNTPPRIVREADSFGTFKSQLKSYHFREQNGAFSRATDSLLNNLLINTIKYCAGHL